MTSTIVCKLPKQSVPDLYLKKVLLACPGAFGFIGQERQQDGKTKLVIEQSPKSIMLEELKELQEAFKNEHLAMWFSEAVKNEEDIQPWTLTDGADEPTHLLAMMYEGNFEKYAGKNGDHSAEYVVSDQEIFPRLAALFTVSGQDWNKLYAALKAKDFQDALNNCFNNRGVYVFMPPEGEPVSFGKNDIGGQFAWGNVSNAHGYSEKPAVEDKPSGLAFLRGKAKSTAAPVAPAAPIPEPTPAAPVTDPKEDQTKSEPVVEPKTEYKEVNGVKLFKMGPPPKLLGNKKALNLWLRTFNRNQLDEETQRTRVVWVPTELIPFAQRIVGSKDEVEDLVVQIKNFKAAAALSPEKDSKPIMTPEHMVASTRREPASNYLPTMNDEEKTRAKGRMDKFRQKGSQPTGLEIQKMESNWPVFHEAVGCTFEELCTRPVSELLELFDNSKIAACAFIEMRKRFLEASGLNLDSMSKKLGSKVDETKETKSEPEESGAFSFLRGKKKTA